MNKANKYTKIISRILIILMVITTVVIAIFFMQINDRKSVTSSNFYASKNAIKMQQNNLTKLSTFSTSFEASVDNRAHNIILASSQFNGVQIPRGGSISFNEIVGARTYDRGYLDANVIMKGVYVKGVGGGVCQVSSTIYNSWLMAGLDVTSSRAHSLPSTYVALSRDATVSSEIDLVMSNCSDSEVVIEVLTDNNILEISIFGRARENEYLLISDVIEEVPTYFAPDVTIEVNDMSEVGEQLYAGKSGYKSRLIIEVIHDGTVIARRELRRDSYNATPSQKVIKILKGSAI